MFYFPADFIFQLLPMHRYSAQDLTFANHLVVTVIFYNIGPASEEVVHLPYTKWVCTFHFQKVRFFRKVFFRKVFFRPPIEIDASK
jgi:hypothetical protein